MAPEFLPEQHATYVEFIEAAIADPDARNIALSGAYGTGKSSVLMGLRARLKSDSWLQISLTEVTRTGKEFTEASGEGTVTAALQKEVVKRLLYSVTPSKLPRSRFSRIRRPRISSATAIALIFAGILELAGIGLGVASPVATWIETALPKESWIGRALEFVLLFSMALVAQLIWSSSRLTEIGVGPARIGLAQGVTNYFDQYLDELIYFFEKTNVQVVLFEDLDRFHDPGIFQELRELNGLLNSAEQVRRRIVFIYAMRDSLFKPVEGRSREAMAGVDTPASDRAKFFDYIVPIAPFISSEVGADLLSQELDDIPTSMRPGDEIIRIVGNRFADLRVLRSIRNEYLVFHRAIYEATRVDGLTQDEQFAMVAYKHENLADFEKIRVADSDLDHTLRKVVALVASRVASLDAEIAFHVQQISSDAQMVSRAAEAGHNLRAGFDLSLATVGNQLERIEIDGASFSREDLDQIGFWRAIANATGTTVTVVLASGTRSTVSTDAFVRDIAHEVPPAVWLKSSREDALAALESTRALRQRLLSATLAERVTDRSFVGPGPDGETIDIPKAVEDGLGAGLALEMIRSGYLDQNFALYTTAYYGKFVSANARSFMLQYVDRHVTAALFELSARDVQSIVEVRGDELFSDPSALNVSIFNTLLGDPRLQETTHRLVDLGQEGEEFIVTFLTSGAKPLDLLPHLVPYNPRAIQLIFESNRITEPVKVGFLIEALRNLDKSIEYELSDAAGAFLAQKVVSRTVSRSVSSKRAQALARFLSRHEIPVPDLRRASAPVQRAVVESRIFAINRENLLAISEDGTGVGLDTIAEASRSAFEYLLEHMGDYLLAVGPRGRSVDGPARLSELVTTVAKAAPDSLQGFLAKVPRQFSIELDASIPETLWPEIAESGHLSPSVANIDNFLSEHPAQASSLSEVVRRSTKITGVGGATESARRRVAIAIAASSAPIRKRSTMIRGLGLATPLTAAEVPTTDSKLVGELLRGGLLEDSVATFSSLASAPWDTREAAIAASKSFAENVADLSWPPGEVGRVLTSTIIDTRTKAAVAEYVPLIHSGLDTSDSSAFLRYSVAGEAPLPMSLLQALVLTATVTSVIEYLGESPWPLPWSAYSTILASLPGEYSRLGLAGERPTLPDSIGLRSLVDKLQKDGVAGAAIERKDGRLQIFMKGSR